MDTTHTENLTLRSLYVFVLVLLLHNTLSQTQWFKAVPIYYLLTPVVRSLDTMQLNAQGLTRLKSNQDAMELCSHVELIQGLGSSSKLTQTISRILFLDVVGMKSLGFFIGYWLGIALRFQNAPSSPHFMVPSIGRTQHGYFLLQGQNEDLPHFQTLRPLSSLTFKLLFKGIT